MCWNITRLSLWLLRNVHFVKSTQRTRLQTRPFVRGINNLLKLDVCASRNQVVATCLWQELEYRIDVRRVTRGAHTSNISSCTKKKTFSVFLWL